MFVYHHQSPPPGLAVLFGGIPRRFLISQLYSKEKGFLYLALEMCFFKSTHVHFIIWYTNVDTEQLLRGINQKGRRICGDAHIYLWGFFFQTVAELMLVGRSKQCPRETELAGSQAQPECLYRSYSALALEFFSLPASSPPPKMKTRVENNLLVQKWGIKQSPFPCLCPLLLFTLLFFSLSVSWSRLDRILHPSSFSCCFHHDVYTCCISLMKLSDVFSHL